MSRQTELELRLFADQPYRWNDNITTDMSLSTKVHYLAAEARKCVDLTEHEVGYGILRELLELEPCHSSEYWRLLATCCRSLRKKDEADAAERNAQVLERKGESLNKPLRNDFD